MNHITPDQIMVTPGRQVGTVRHAGRAGRSGRRGAACSDPSWVSYCADGVLHRGVPVRVPLRSGTGFRSRPTLLERDVTRKTKLLMVNSPNNPTGRVLTRAEIDAIVYVACQHDLYVLSDEIYEHIIFDDHVHYSLAAEPGMAERTIIVNGFSKAYAMTGWRLGWLAGPQQIVKLARVSTRRTASRRPPALPWPQASRR